MNGNRNVTFQGRDIGDAVDIDFDIPVEVDPDTGLATASLSGAFSARAPRVDVERQVLSNGKGGRIGTAGKVPVAFRIDDGQDQLISKSIVEKFSTRAWPCSLALCSSFDTQSWNQNVTWAQIRTWVEQHGAEIWSHGTNHISPYDANPTTFQANLEREIVSSKAAIEDEGLRCMGWTMPGVAEPGYGTTLSTFDAYHSTEAGKLVRETYALSESDVASWFRTLPTNLRLGLGHFTISDGAGLVASKAALDTAISYGRGIEFMLHPDQLDLPGKLTTAQLDEFLTYVADKVTAGSVVVVAPSSMPFCDPGSDRWLNLLANGRFTGPIANVSSGDGVWRHVNGTTTTLEETTRHDSSTGNVLQFAGADGTIATQQLASVENEGYAGQPLRFSGWARGIDTGDGVIARGRFRAETISGDGPYVWTLDKNVFTLTSDWALKEFVFTPPPWASAINFSIGKGFGSGGTTASKVMQWDDVSIRPA